MWCAAGWLCHGLFGWSFLAFAGAASEYALIFLLFLVGIQLRNSGMTLRQILINRRGMLVSLIVVVTSLLGGALAALIAGCRSKPGWRSPPASAGIRCPVFC